mgnify:CR=1 FL=1
MRDRTKQREKRKLKRQMIAMRNACGVVDPTPYYAVKNMLEEQSKKSGSSNKNEQAHIYEGTGRIGQTSKSAKWEGW